MLKKAMDTSRLDKAIEELENAIIGADPEAEKYQKMVTSLETLHKLRAGKHVSTWEFKDMMAFLGPLLGIIIICVFEAYGHTIVSKGLGFVSKQKS
ncbi:membrane protein [Microbacterium phage Damascus]|nr:membrane protein [Microbacterium phage Damascus]